jgi:hypothetical protein
MASKLNNRRSGEERKRLMAELEISPTSLQDLEGHLGIYEKLFSKLLGADPEDSWTELIADRPDYARLLFGAIEFYLKTVSAIRDDDAGDAVLNSLNMCCCVSVLCRENDRVRQRSVLAKGPAKRKHIGQNRAAEILREFSEIMSEPSPPPSKAAGRDKLLDRLAARLGEDAPSMSTIEKVTKIKRADGKKAARTKAKR